MRVRSGRLAVEEQRLLVGGECRFDVVGVRGDCLPKPGAVEHRQVRAPAGRRRQVCGITEGLIGSVIGLPGLALAVPDHSTLGRRAETLGVPRPQPRRDGEPLHRLVDSTGLTPCGAGEWLVEKHSAKTRWSPRKLHIGLDADTGQVVAAALTTEDIDDGAGLFGKQDVRRVLDPGDGDTAAELIVHLVPVWLGNRGVVLGEHLQQRHDPAGPEGLQAARLDSLLLHPQRRGIPAAQPEAWVVAGGKEALPQGCEPLGLRGGRIAGDERRLLTCSGTLDASAAASTTAVTKSG